MQCSWKVVGPQGTRLTPGIYRVLLVSQTALQEFFGLPAILGSGPPVIVKEREPGDANRYLEDLIERHYLYGDALYSFDAGASKKEFEKGWGVGFRVHPRRCRRRT